MHQRYLGIELLFRNRILGQQTLVAGQVDPGVFQLRLVAQQRALRLVQAGLEGARIDLRQLLAGLHLLAFDKIEALQHAADLGVHDGGIRGGNIAYRRDQHADILLARHLHGNRRWRRGPAPWPSLSMCAPPATFMRLACSLALGLLMGVPPPAASAGNSQQGHQQPRQNAPLGAHRKNGLGRTRHLLPLKFLFYNVKVYTRPMFLIAGCVTTAPLPPDGGNGAPDQKRRPWWKPPPKCAPMPITGRPKLPYP